MQAVHKIFKSEDERFEIVRNIRTGKLLLFTQLKMVHNSPLLEFTIEPRFADNVQLEEIYRREETHTLVYKVTLSDEISVVMKLYRIPTSQTDKTDNTETVSNYEIEVRYLKIFTDMVQQLVCPHFTLPIGHCTLDEKQLQSLLDHNVDIKEGTYMLLLSECADSTFNRLLRQETLDDYAISGILFQTVLSLYIIHDVFPSFRHNDLHLSNVLIQLLDGEALKREVKADGVFVKYVVHGKKYYINLGKCPQRVLLWDMYYSSINAADAKRYQLARVVPQKKQLFLTGDKTATRSCTNQYFDLHKLFDSLEFVLSQRSKEYREKLNPQLLSLIQKVVPPHLKCMSKGLTHKDKTDMRLWEAKHVTPKEVLRDPYFQRFTKSDPDRVVAREYIHPRLNQEKGSLSYSK